MNVKIDGIELRGSKRTARSLVVHEFASKGCAHMTEHEDINVGHTRSETFFGYPICLFYRELLVDLQKLRTDSRISVYLME